VPASTTDPSVASHPVFLDRKANNSKQQMMEIRGTGRNIFVVVVFRRFWFLASVASCNKRIQRDDVFISLVRRQKLGNSNNTQRKQWKYCMM